MATSGTLEITGSVHTGGTLVVDSGATLRLDSTSTDTAQYQPAVLVSNKLVGGTLLLEDPTGFTGPIDGFAPSDTIDLGGTTVTSAVIIGNTLTAVGAGGTLTYVVNGSFGSDRVATFADGSGGTDLVLFREASASTVIPNPVNFGVLHVNQAAVTQNETIANTASNDGYSENLDASITVASPFTTPTSMVNEIGPGQSSSACSATSRLDTRHRLQRRLGSRFRLDEECHRAR